MSTTVPTGLDQLCRNVAEVRRTRSFIRVGRGIGLFLAVLLAGLFVAFLLDVATHMGRLERFVILLLLIALGVWAFRRFVWPTFGQQESLLETAMIIEEGQGGSSDLIAAMQFSEDRPQFGSASLRRETIERTSDLAPLYETRHAVSGGALNQLWMLGLGLLAALLLVAFLPGYSKAFFQRLFLGQAHYPTDTQIESVVSPDAKTPFGHPLAFIVAGGGVLPPDGHVTLRGLDSNLRSTIPLGRSGGLYTGRIDRVVEAFEYQVFLGDAYTDPATVELTPLPIVTVDFDIQTPDYARERFDEENRRRRGRSALQGSRIQPIVTCSNKTLRAAAITLRTGQTETVVPLEAADGSFRLPPDHPSLANLGASLHWSVQVEDEDGLSPERAPAGVIQIRPDQPPQAAIISASTLVWSQAKPRLRYKVIDDFALGPVQLHLMVQKLGSSNLVNTVRQLDAVEDHRPSLSGSLALDLASLSLAKGDRLMVQLEASDFRGKQDGVTRRSDTLQFEVSDRESVLLALREEVDTQSEEKLEQIINAQLGIGDSP